MTVQTKTKSLTDSDRELNKYKEELQELKVKYDFTLKALESTEEKLNILKGLRRDREKFKLKHLRSSGDSIAILNWSDWHLAEKVELSTVNNLNEYNIEIARKRINKSVENAVMMIDVARGMSKIDTIVVALLGDFISGSLHDDQKETDLLSPTESIDLCGDFIINGLEFIKKESRIPNIIIPTCFGNHGRTTPKPRSSTAHKTNYEQLMYWHLAKTNKKFNWLIGNSYHNYLPIFDRVYRFHHGDSIKYLGGIGGLQIPAMKAISDWDRTIPAYHDIFGHYHTTSFTRKYSSNGSVVGFNSYALRNKCQYEEPSQNLIISSQKRGNVLSVQIFCD